ncbi:hypothetical protein LP52_05185 [Streptomonospora alba]|uniref:DUF4097 domain-containing protein n=1 Tax=Streptomonospora alba TaxID=183763 RepID=A0A0C2G8H7_9ACTN|nr:DUF4097 family beta strand repeat-containing protein [Streptomonospora alba]KIH99653.1 hypothetical protein LP52_05185 [Streptomonospora alba]
MPNFDTPEPITAEIDLFIGTIQIDAGDRADTTVEVHPRDAAKDADVRLAEQIQIEYGGGRLVVKDPNNTGLGRLLRKGVADVTIELPAGSQLQVEADNANIRCDGLLGDSRVTASLGNLVLDRVAGHAELTSTHGLIRAREIDGTAAVKTTHGSITLGTVTGRLRMKTAHGDIVVDRALDSVEAKTAHGGVRIREVVRGRVDLETSYRELEVGIAEGTAAWLDVGSKHGSVSSSLEAAEDPGDAGETVEVRARTNYGDVVVRRA